MLFMEWVFSIIIHHNKLTATTFMYFFFHPNFFPHNNQMIPKKDWNYFSLLLRWIYSRIGNISHNVIYWTDYSLTIKHIRHSNNKTETRPNLKGFEWMSYSVKYYQTTDIINWILWNDCIIIIISLIIQLLKSTKFKRKFPNII